MLVLIYYSFSSKLNHKQHPEKKINKPYAASTSDWLSPYCVIFNWQINHFNDIWQNSCIPVCGCSIVKKLFYLDFDFPQQQCSFNHSILPQGNPFEHVNQSYLQLWHYPQTAAGFCLFAPPSQNATHCHSASDPQTVSLVLYLPWRSGRNFKIRKIIMGMMWAIQAQFILRQATVED